MDSVRVEWLADDDTYAVHIPGQPTVVATLKELEELQTELARTMQELSA